MPQIEVVGIGLDGIAGLSPKVRQIVARATLLVGSDRHLNYFPNHPAQRLVLKDLSATIAKIAARIDTEKCIVVLVSGDPLFFGLGRLLLHKLPPKQLQFHPHLSSIQLAFNRIKVPWQDAQILSLHGRSLEQITPLLQQGIGKIALLTDQTNDPRAIASYYLSLDLSSCYDFWVCENLGANSERISFFGEGEKLATSVEDFAALNVVILLRNGSENVPDLNRLPQIGIPDHDFVSFSDRPGLMTKREIRPIILGELALQPKQIVWDIGAGTGSVSIEIARLCPTSIVYGIEKTAAGIGLIEQNCQRLQVTNVVPVYGTAPDILANLPAPERIFIGGSGGNLEAILAMCDRTLIRDGVVVLALATLEHLHSSLEWFQAHAWDYRLLQVQISRSVPIANLTRFMPLNPITIITATR